MRKTMAVSAAAIVVGLGILSLPATHAQTSASPTWQDTPSRYHQWMYRMIKDMTEEMGRMSEQMSRADLDPEQRQQMAQRMGQMSTMMRAISDLVRRPAIREADWPKKMDQMRKQMDDMMHDSRMRPPG